MVRWAIPSTYPDHFAEVNERICRPTTEVTSIANSRLASPRMSFRDIVAHMKSGIHRRMAVVHREPRFA